MDNREGNGRTIKIKRGLDIPLSGAAEGLTETDSRTRLVGIVPDDFRGYVWKARVAAGDMVKAGDTLLSDKETGRICLTSPVSGQIAEIQRGERRKIEAVTVRSDSPVDEACHSAGKPAAGDRSALVEGMCRTGLWVLLSQRPFDIIPDPDIVPRDIFVTAFDSAPLAPAMPQPHLGKYLEPGLKALATLTAGRVYLGIRSGSGIVSDTAEVYTFDGPHPAGNAGVQIAAVKPVNKGDTVWTLTADTAARIGRYVSDGVVDYSTTVAICGQSAVRPALVRTSIGAALATLLDGHLPTPADDIRVISGNVLTGKRVNPSTGFLRMPYTQITVIPEGAHADEFMGWASMSPKKYSVKRTFPAFLRGLVKPFPFDARIKGGHRAMILSGEYDKVFPMDIYPEYLLKAIFAGDFDRMEKLGIYEVAPEDFALPEFVDTSKTELQKAVREGLDLFRKES